MVLPHFLMIVILVVTVVLLILDFLRIDLVAMLCMLTLAWSGILEPREVFLGFSSNAVIAMIAVMIMGNGISRTGIMDRFSQWIMRIAKGSKRKLIVLVFLSVGLLSAFIQNIGAAVLFLPAIMGMAKRERYHASELIMPMGFAAILGGTLTMVASGPLIILNDLLRDANLKTFGFFAVTPVGFLLLFTGIAYFFFLGEYVLPKKSKGQSRSDQKQLIDSWHLPSQIYRYRIPEKSILVGKTPEVSGLWDRYQLNILALSKDKEIEYAPWRETHFKEGQQLVLLGEEKKVKKFAQDCDLLLMDESNIFQDFQNPEKTGFVETVVSPRSDFAGKTIRQLAIRKNFHVEPILVFSQGNIVRGDFSDKTLTPGDILIFHGLWENIGRLKDSGHIIVLTPLVRIQEKNKKPWIALACFGIGIGLVIAGYPISISLFSGAVAMVLTGVLSIHDFYTAIEWKVVFLIAGLIPLGIAMEKTGIAAFLAEQILSITQGKHLFLILFAIALLSTVFSLLMSNVASTVILAPLVINLASLIQLDARPLVLLVAVCAANSFILPTHQVNAMLITAGGYNNADYLKAGGIMTLLFLLAVTMVFYFFYF